MVLRVVAVRQVDGSWWEPVDVGRVVHDIHVYVNGALNLPVVLVRRFGVQQNDFVAAVPEHVQRERRNVERRRDHNQVRPPVIDRGPERSTRHVDRFVGGVASLLVELQPGSEVGVTNVAARGGEGFRPSPVNVGHAEVRPGLHHENPQNPSSRPIITSDEATQQSSSVTHWNAQRSGP